MIPKSVEEQLLFSTLRLELLSEENKLQCIGTGFLLSAKLNEQQSILLLISNKHVLESGKRIRILFHKKSPNDLGPELGRTYEVCLNHTSLLIEHPDPDIDIACLNISYFINNLLNEIYFKFVDESLLASFDEEELDIAQRVFFIGYPDDRFDYVHNLPIVRAGIIASHPKIDFNGKKQFIIDAQVFPGSSGSPVIINLTYENYKNRIVLGEHKIRLLGIVSATMIRYNQLKALPTNLSNLVSTETIGLGIVFKSTAIRELIDLVIKDLKKN